MQKILQSIEAPIPTKAPAPTETPIPSEPPVAEPSETIPPVDYQAFRPYEIGQIMIIMYHGITDGEETNSYIRNANNFTQDMQTLYEMGFRLASVKDWINNEIKVEAGFTPVIFTFDDGLSTTFSLSEDLQPIENCAVDLMDKFSRLHPDFGNTAMFFINGDAEQFKGGGTLPQRLQYLVDHGYELGNHTYSHAKLNALDALGIQKEIGLVDQLIKDSVPGYEPYGLSYPFGIRPKEELRNYILSGSYEGRPYSYAFGVREGQSGPPSALNRNGFDPLNVPRVRGSNDEATDLGWHLELYSQNPQGRYISDGDPNTVCVPEESAESINMDSLDGKQLIIY
ncbi:MAG: polysaccharide deacetylase family protein [Clostridiales bacterium]|nr:polysaccharide deacetylase family protein [Clostridiales bacterium]